MKILLSIFVVNFCLMTTAFSHSIASKLTEQEIDTLSFLEQHRMQVLRKLLPGLLADLKFKKEYTNECNKYLQKYIVESDLSLRDDLQVDPSLISDPERIKAWLHYYRHGIEKLSLDLQNDRNMSGEQCMIFAILFNIKHGDTQLFEFVSELNELVENKKIDLGDSGDFSMYILNIIHCSFKALVLEIQRHSFDESSSVSCSEEATTEFEGSSLEPFEIEALENVSLDSQNNDDKADFDIEAQVFPNKQDSEDDKKDISQYAKYTIGGSLLFAAGFGGYELASMLSSST